MIIYLTLVVLGVFVSLFVYLAIVSPGKPEVFRNENGGILEGGISEKIFVQIGGVSQGMFIRTKNVENPVLLFLHGGPCFPNYFLFEKYEPGLEDYFTVCYWEQRGGGLSFTPEVTMESMTLKQLSADAIEVTNYLRKRFGKEKIYIMAWSGGTTIALPAVSEHPKLFHAYIAIAQIVRQSESERIAYDFMLEQLAEMKDHKTIKELEKYRDLESESDLISFFNSPIRDNLMHKLGIGTMRQMKSVITGVFIPSLQCRAYTLKEKLIMWKSKLLFLPRSDLKLQVLTKDFSEYCTEIEIPIYFVSGKYDLTVNIDVSKGFYDQISFPLKGFYTFDNSAHAPLFEEQGRFREVLERDVLHANFNLADK